MEDYYIYFELDNTGNILEAMETLALFLTRTREEASELESEKERQEKFKQALNVAKEVCKNFSTTNEKIMCQEYVDKQKLILSKIYNIKENVTPIEDFYIKSKKSWARIINCLIPSLEDEKKMFFLANEDDILEILTFVVQNVEYYFSLQGINKNSYFVSLDIIKKSFDIAKSRKRDTVKIEDIVASINNCEMLGDYERSKLSAMVFDRWYKTENKHYGEKKKSKKVKRKY